MTEDQLEQLKRESEFAQMGKQVVNNKAYQDAIAVRRAQIFEVFCNTKHDQSDVREEAWRTMKNMDALEQFLNNILTTGKMADSALESIEETEN